MQNQTFDSDYYNDNADVNYNNDYIHDNEIYYFIMIDTIYMIDIVTMICVYLTCVYFDIIIQCVCDNIFKCFYIRMICTKQLYYLFTFKSAHADNPDNPDLNINININVH